MRSLSLYRPTQTTPCGYLPNHWSRSDYVDPRVALTTEELTQLNRLGFRRSGQLLYRPACPDCNACESARFEPLKLRINRRLKRAIKYCRPFHLAVETAHYSDEHYRLYRAYINARHRDGAMYPPSQQQYEEFITSHFGNTAFLTLRCGEQLIGCLVFDLLQDGVSSVYCYFDTHYEHCSPGRYLIYSLSAVAIALKLPYHYLGYYIDNCKKMTYKAEWQPLDLLQNGVWQAKS
ncbi:arginyltransferase [Bacterioplanes sanyensis]|uniref:Arginyltransferase n=1 Tax=Bacterioplanes sanyensis TaxID=1249553 RepID=A0A222FM76_9GAMM|nr:GNAT family N-acetyltransferase [Bacterioplanes sanyensis]ASP39772.1 arginyltransferase [Bacterioplanes sanyensis]